MIIMGTAIFILVDLCFGVFIGYLIWVYGRKLYGLSEYYRGKSEMRQQMNNIYKYDQIIAKYGSRM